MASLIHRIKFTSAVDEALQQLSDGYGTHFNYLHKIKHGIKARRAAALVALRSNIPKQRRKELCKLTLVYKEQLDILSDLIASSSPIKDWQNELHFYEKNDGTIFCACAGRKIEVENHFPRCDMLVVTSLTRQVRRDFFNAFSEEKVLLLSGPAGTGKTETFKDTCKLIGRECGVIRCFADLNESQVSRFLDEYQDQGVCFDEINKLSGNIQQKFISLAMKKTKLVAATFNPQHGGVALAKDLVVMRSMTRPKYDVLYQCMLGHEGFIDCDALGNKLHLALETMHTKMSKEAHYDFGLRLGKTIARTAGIIARKDSFADESDSLSNAIVSCVFIRSTSADKEIALEVISSIFNDDFDIEVPKIWTSDGPAAVGAMVAETAKIRHGICVIKADDIDASVAAIEKCTDAKSIEVVHGSLSPEFNNPQHPIVAALRACAQTDGPVNIVVRLLLGYNTKSLQALNSLLDDNKKLCIDNGETLHLPGHARVIVFAVSVHNWSPAFISRLGFVNGARMKPKIDWHKKYLEAERQRKETQAELDGLRNQLSGLLSTC